jgi:protein TonB
MFARIALAVPFGAGVTAALFFAMNLMIDSGHRTTETAAARIVDFVHIQRNDVIETREERPERPEAAERAPDMPQPVAAQVFAGEIRVAMAGPKLGFGEASLGSLGFGAGSDGEYIPIVKVAPSYPMRAAQRRLEGHVIVEFVVTTSGAVRDVVVVESTSELFEQAAIEAALKFKYKPRIVDGQPIEVAGVQNKITFRLSA